jgi:TPR repeat protein
MYQIAVSSANQDIQYLSPFIHSAFQNNGFDLEAENWNPSCELWEGFAASQTSCGTGLVMYNSLKNKENFRLGCQEFDNENYQQAYNYFIELAQRGNPDAKQKIGHIYYRVNELSKARDWLRSAANQGHVAAQKDLRIVEKKIIQEQNSCLIL